MQSKLVIPDGMVIRSRSGCRKTRQWFGVLWRLPLFAGLSLFAETLVPSVCAATITINGATTYQVIDGFGVNCNTHSWTNTELEPVFDAFIDEAGLTIFQLNIINSNWEMTNDNSDANVMNWAYYNTIYTNLDFQKLWGTMAYLNYRGLSNGVIPKAGGPGPLWLGGLSLTNGDEDEYAETMASFIIFGRTNQQLSFHELRAVNEPDITYSGVNMTESQEITVYHDLALKFVTNGMSDIRFSGPDLSVFNTNWVAAMMSDPVIMSNVAHIGAHFYQTGAGDPTAVTPFIQHSAYPNMHWWATECAVWCANCNNGISGNNTWGYAQSNAYWVDYLLSEGASACVVYEAFDGEYYGYSATTGQNTPATWYFWGLMAVNNTNASPRTYSPRSQFYTLAQIAKFVLPGAQRISMDATPSGLTALAFYNTNNSQFTITGVNSNSTTTTMSCALSSLPTIPSLSLYYTTSATNLAQGATVVVTNNSFTAAIPASSVFTLTYINPAPFSLTPSLQNSNLSLSLSGSAGFTYQIQASTNLSNWTVLTNLFNSSGTIGFTDTNTPAFSARYYRAMLTN